MGLQQSNESSQSIQSTQDIQLKPKITLLLIGTNPQDVETIISLLSTLDSSQLQGAIKHSTRIMQSKSPGKPTTTEFFWYDRMFEIKVPTDPNYSNLTYDIGVICYDEAHDPVVIKKHIEKCYADTNNFRNSTYSKNIVLSYHKVSGSTTSLNILEIDKAINKNKMTKVHSFIGDHKSFERVLGSARDIANGQK